MVAKRVLNWRRIWTTTYVNLFKDDNDLNLKGIGVWRAEQIIYNDAGNGDSKKFTCIEANRGVYNFHFHHVRAV